MMRERGPPWQSIWIQSTEDMLLCTDHNETILLNLKLAQIYISLTIHPKQALSLNKLLHSSVLHFYSHNTILKKLDEISYRITFQKSSLLLLSLTKLSGTVSLQNWPPFGLILLSVKIHCNSRVPTIKSFYIVLDLERPPLKSGRRIRTALH